MRMLVTAALMACACSAGQAPQKNTRSTAGGEQSSTAKNLPRARGLLADICHDTTYRVPTLASATVEKLAEGFSFVEGPVWVEKSASLFFSDMQPGAGADGVQPSHVRQWRSAGSGADVYIENAGSNGLALGTDGRLYACTHDQQSVSAFDLSSKARSLVAERTSGKRFNSPNDLVLHENGSVYFTDPGWQKGKRESETAVTGIYRAAKDGSVTLVDDSRENPNGITLSPDETALYVNASDDRVLRYAVREDGSTGPGEAFSSVPVPVPDGMTVDCAGNVYATAHTAGEIIVFDPAGKHLGTIAVAAKLTNVAFGGPEHRTLFATSGTALYAIELDIAGRPY